VLLASLYSIFGLFMPCFVYQQQLYMNINQRVICCYFSDDEPSSNEDDESSSDETDDDRASDRRQYMTKHRAAAKS